MKAIEKVSNTATTPKFWLPLIFGASLIYMGNPPQAGEQQGTESQGSGRGTMPSPGYTDDRARNQGSNTLERGGKRMEQEIDRSGSDSMDRGTTPSSERGTNPDVDLYPKPGSEPMNKGTTRTIPGSGSGTNPDVNMGNRPGGEGTGSGAQ